MFRVKASRVKQRIVLMVAFVAAMMLGIAPAVQAAAACHPRVYMALASGPGHPGTVVAGTWQCDGGIGFCIDFPRHEPEQAGGVLDVNRAPGATAAESKLIFHIDGKYRLTDNRTVAAKAQIAIWELKHRVGNAQGDKDYRTYRNKKLKVAYPGLWSGAQAMIAEAKKAVDATMSVTIRPGQVGTTKAGNAQLTGAKGVALSGYTVRLSSSNNAELSRKSGVTNQDGKVGFQLNRTDLGKVTVSARATMPSLTRAVLTVPGGAMHQRILIGKYTRSVNAKADYALSPGKATITSQCDTDCDGQATVTAKVCSEGGPIRLFVGKNGDQTGSVDVAGGKCLTKEVRAFDDDRLAFEGCYLTKVGGTCNTDRFNLGTYHVVCPPWAEAFVKVECDCNGTNATQVAYLAPGSSVRGYDGLLKLPSGEVREYALTNGQLKEVNLPAGVSGQIQLGFKVYTDASKQTLLRTVWFPGGVTIN